MDSTQRTKRIIELKEKEISSLEEQLIVLKQRLEKAKKAVADKSVSFALVGDAYEGLAAMNFVFIGDLIYSKYGDIGRITHIDTSTDNPFLSKISFLNEDTNQEKELTADRLNY
jgi:hypothetical protein